MQSPSPSPSPRASDLQAENEGGEETGSEGGDKHAHRRCIRPVLAPLLLQIRASVTKHWRYWCRSGDVWSSQCIDLLLSAALRGHLQPHQASRVCTVQCSWTGQNSRDSSQILGCIELHSSSALWRGHALHLAAHATCMPMLSLSILTKVLVYIYACPLQLSTLCSICNFRVPSAHLQRPVHAMHSICHCSPVNAVLLESPVHALCKCPSFSPPYHCTHIHRQLREHRGSLPAVRNSSNMHSSILDHSTDSGPIPVVNTPKEYPTHRRRSDDTWCQPLRDPVTGDVWMECSDCGNGLGSSMFCPVTGFPHLYSENLRTKAMRPDDPVWSDAWQQMNMGLCHDRVRQTHRHGNHKTMRLIGKRFLTHSLTKNLITQERPSGH